MKTCGRCILVLPLASFAKNPGKKDGVSAVCKSCHRTHYAAWAAKQGNKERALASRREKRRKDPRTYLFNEARSRAKTFGKVFSITLDDVVMPERCPVFGELLVVRGEPGNWFSASLDEIVYGLGYVPGNVQVISKLANCMKHKASPEQLIQFSMWALELFDGSKKEELDPSSSPGTHKDQYVGAPAYQTRTWQAGVVENPGDCHPDPFTQDHAGPQRH